MPKVEIGLSRTCPSGVWGLGPSGTGLSTMKDGLRHCGALVEDVTQHHPRSITTHASHRTPAWVVGKLQCPHPSRSVRYLQVLGSCTNQSMFLVSFMLTSPGVLCVWVGGGGKGQWGRSCVLRIQQPDRDFLCGNDSKPPSMLFNGGCTTHGPNLFVVV